uniref:Uncharacterized protein n=1 Tax=Penaeus monodon majanivirus B TaxID=2984272 RepID=A0A9C7F6F0_9VIRU|nr:MAG: hypothetical protein [Penaeus monodon majanivirus B]
MRTMIRDLRTASKWLRVINADRGKISPIVFPDELKYWEEKELCNFTLDSDSVDRIYCLDVLCPYFTEVFRLILRMQYKSRPLYVEVVLIDRVLTRKGNSTMILTYDIQRFLDSIIRSHKKREIILKRMLLDKINIQKSWGDVSSLEYLCYQTICKYRNELCIREEEIPRVVWNNICKTIEIQKIVERYERKVFDIYKSDVLTVLF